MPRPTRSTPTTASATPLLVPTSASLPDSPPTMKTRPMRMLLIDVLPVERRGHDSGPAGSGIGPPSRSILNHISINNFPHDSHLSTFGVGFDGAHSTPHQHPISPHAVLIVDKSCTHAVV